MKKILFIAAHRPDRSPSQRFRFEQYFEYLNQNGFQCNLSYLISEKDDTHFYSTGHYFRKFWILCKSTLIRIKDVIRSKKYDIIFVQREAFMTGTIFFEKLFKRSNAKIVFDFDDSIWLQDNSPVNNKLAWLKDAGKTSKLIAISDLIIAGNDFLASYARKFNDHVEIVPTTIDTSEYKAKRPRNHTLVIGWSGSFSTVKHFESALPALEKIYEKYGGKVDFKLIGDGKFKYTKLGIKGLAWNKDDEIKELSSFDIGIMPLPDDEWSKGKCGLKGLQYMALGIPTIMSPVGVNSEIIEDGKNGFLAKNEKEWIDKISQLIDSKDLRNRIGENGRKTVLDYYSVDANKHKYLELFTQLLS